MPRPVPAALDLAELTAILGSCQCERAHRIRAGCHPDAALWVGWHAGLGVLQLRCAAPGCGRHVVSVQVAPGPEA